MIVQTDHEAQRGGSRGRSDALSALAGSVAAAANERSLEGALEVLVDAARAVAGAEVAIVRIRAAGTDRFEAVAVSGPATLVAELEGTFVPADETPTATVESLDGAPDAVRHAA